MLSHFLSFPAVAVQVLKSWSAGVELYYLFLVPTKPEDQSGHVSSSLNSVLNVLSKGNRLAAAAN